MINKFYRLGKIIILPMIIMFFLTVKVDASECSSNIKNELKKEAANIEFISILKEEDYVGSYMMSFTNFSDKFYITDSTGNRYEYSNKHTDDLIYGEYLPNKEIIFKIYAAYGSECSGELLQTKKVKIPAYNNYANIEECQEVEEFYLCSITYDGEIESKEWLISQIEGYKNGTIKNPIEEKEKKNFLEKNTPLVIIVAIIIILIIIYISYLFKNKKKKVKINLSKPKKYIFMFLMLSLVSLPMQCFANDHSTGGTSTGSGDAPKQAAWYYVSGDLGVRLSLYKYDGKDLKNIKSIEILNNPRSSSYITVSPNAKGRFDYNDNAIYFYEGDNFSYPNYNRVITNKFSDYLKTDRTRYFTDIDTEYIDEKGRAWGPRLADEISEYFGHDNDTVKNQIKNMFGITVNDEDLSKYYIYAEPLLGIYNRVINKAILGTAYEIMNSNLNTYDKSDYYNDDEYNLALRSNFSGFIRRFLYNGIYAKTDSSKLFSNNGVKDGRYDYYNFINQNGDENAIIHTSNVVLSSFDDIDFKNKQTPYGGTVFWIGKVAMECSYTCADKTGDALLKCAENFCSNQESVKNSSEKKECIVNKCNYTYEKLSCSSDNVTNGNKTICSDKTTSNKSTCQIVNKENISYKIECNTTSTVTYPTSLPTSVLAGKDIEYQVNLYGNKTCNITLDEELWKFNYAASYTDSERENLINAVNNYNRLSFNEQTYDSKEGNISIKISEKVSGKNQTTNKNLKAEENYYKGSLKVTTTSTNHNVTSFHKNVNKTVTFKKYVTDSSNGTLYNLPGVCISSRDNMSVYEGTNCENNLGPYNKYYTSVYADIAKNNTETKVVHSASGLDVNNDCNYEVAENELSCYITATTRSNQTGNILVNNEDIIFNLYVVSNSNKQISYNLGNTIKLKGDAFNNLNEKIILANTIRENTKETIYGTVTDGTNYAYCKKEVTLTPSSCSFTVQENQNNTKTIFLNKINNLTAEYYMKDSTSNKWMYISSKTIPSNTKITIWGRVKTSSGGNYCVINLDGETEKYNCEKQYKPTEYRKINEYCKINWQKDENGYSSSNDCYVKCTNPPNVSTCKTENKCDETNKIRQYCKVKYQQDGYKSAYDCINDCSCPPSGVNYYYRIVSTNNPFPEREANYNWLGYESYITDDTEDKTPANGSTPEYEIVLDSGRIKSIKEHTKKYNESGKDAYGDYIRVNTKDTGSYKSKFIYEDNLEEGGFKSFFTFIDGVRVGG